MLLRLLLTTKVEIAKESRCPLSLENPLYPLSCEQPDLGHYSCLDITLVRKAS
jgi:hypothetical protein